MIIRDNTLWIFCLCVPGSFPHANKIPCETSINSTYYPINNKKIILYTKADVCVKLKYLVPKKNMQKGRSWHSWCNLFRLFIQTIHSISLPVHESYPHCCVSSPHLIKLTSLAVIENWLVFCPRKTTWIPTCVAFSSDYTFFLYYPLPSHSESIYRISVSTHKNSWLLLEWHHFPMTFFRRHTKIYSSLIYTNKIQLSHQLNILDSVFETAPHSNKDIAPFLKFQYM